MSLVICTLITWLVIIILSLIPKKLSEIDMVFLYFVNIIFELSVFTIFHVNLKWIEVSPVNEKSFADLIIRIIMVPLVLIISSNILLYSWRFLKWIIVIAMVLFFPVMQKLMEWMGILKMNHWNIGYTILMFSSYIAFSRLMAWFILKVDGKEVKKI